MLLPILGCSQGEWNKWYFGQGIAVDFSSGNPLLLPNSAMYTPGMTACISDSLGNMLFYSNGLKIWDRTNAVMPNGTGLLGITGSYQPVFVVPHLPYDSTFFVFTVGNDGVWPGPHYGLYYSIVDLSLNGGLGDIVPGMKNIPVIDADSAYCGLTGIRHYNNHDVWIVLKDQRQSLTYTRYLSYLLSSSGISYPPVISPSLIQNVPLHGQYATSIRISQDGAMLFSKDQGPTSPETEICDFDNQTGVVTPRFKFFSNSTGVYYPHGAEFSVDSKFLYTCSNDTVSSTERVISQFDLSETDSSGFMQSEVVIGHAGMNLRLSTDGKIYITDEFNYGAPSDSFHVINYPTLQGSACNFQKCVFGFGGSFAQYSLPQFLQKYKAYIQSNGLCQNQQIYFTSDIWPPPDSLHWDFGDPTSGSLNFSNDTAPSHLYSLPGQYTVELFVKHIDNRSDTSWITISINETPDPDLGPNQTICQGDSINLDAGACTGCTFEWSSIPPGFISTEQTVTLLQSGIYIVAVSSINGCTGRDTIQLTLTAPPIITNSPLFKSICSGEATSIPLTSNLPGTSYSWNATSSSPSIIGFGPGTGDTINQFLTNTGTISEIVTYTITPSLGDCEGDSVEYVVTVTPGDSVLVSISASDDSICQGTQISYIATQTHGGSAPGYQWKVNGINQGANNSVFNYTPSNHDTVYCILTSSDTVCISNNPATSNEISLTAYPDLPVNISISTTNNPVCDGSIATFAASTSNKGTSPTFQWVVNGNPVGTNDSSYTYTPSNGDQVYCILTSSEQCTSNNPATSDKITMIVNPLLPVGITISASNNPVCEGLPVTYSSTPINGGSSPIYQWQVNGINTGANNPVFSYNPINGDLVTCTLTSNAECTTNNPASSNLITMSVGETPIISFPVCFDTITTLNAQPFNLKGGIPLGGTYSGPGVDQITGYFNPTMAGLGVKTINYSYTNQFNCSNQSVRTITVISPIPFTCDDTLTDIRDNKKYPTIQIGSQCWLAVNLNHGQQIGGSSAQRDNCLVEKYCYNDHPTNCIQYGALYQWDELMRYEDTEEIQGLCPPGWHVPSEADWNQLFTVYQGNAFAGSPLLFTGYSGFNILLAGVEFFNQSHRFADFASIMWSSTSHGSYKAWSHGLNEYNYSVSYYPSYRANAFSVRCLRE